MSRLGTEARMTIKTWAARGATNSHIARLLGVTEGAVRPRKSGVISGSNSMRVKKLPGRRHFSPQN